MIKTNNLTKIYKSKNGEIKALNNVSLHIARGDIYGVIGMSGAGKSTLLRCLGLLEKPNNEEVFINDKDVSKLKGKNLRNFRQELGIIFQGYNLLEQINVAKNIAFPLEIAGYNKADINKRVDELLNLVGLEDKKNSFPSELSGGQKQRVAIARALANNPKILLCDEPTSALDALNISIILKLLKKINEDLGVTIVIITHEISVIQGICNKVAVLDDGKLAEEGKVKTLFKTCKSSIFKNLVTAGGI